MVVIFFRVRFALKTAKYTIKNFGISVKYVLKRNKNYILLKLFYGYDRRICNCDRSRTLHLRPYDLIFFLYYRSIRCSSTWRKSKKKRSCGSEQTPWQFTDLHRPIMCTRCTRYFWQAFIDYELLFFFFIHGRRKYF